MQIAQISKTDRRMKRRPSKIANIGDGLSFFVSEQAASVIHDYVEKKSIEVDHDEDNITEHNIVKQLSRSPTENNSIRATKVRNGTVSCQ